MSGKPLLSLAQIEDLLGEVGHRLGLRGLRVDVLVLGGAAIAMMHDERRVTADVDVAVRGAREALWE